MDQQAIRKTLSAIVATHIPRNCRKYYSRYYDSRPMVTALGIGVDPKPCEGKVIAITDEAVIVKSGRTNFEVVDLSLVSQVPDVGAKVIVTPYCRLDFNGERPDKPNRVEHKREDGTSCFTTTVVIGSPRVKLPLGDLICPYLVDLREQIETLLATDGFRTIANILVDAKATDFTAVDPDEDDILGTPPTISCNVSTEKNMGRLSIIYDRPSDLYVVELRDDDKCFWRETDVDFTSLAASIEKAIDDGTWRTIKIEVITPPSKRSIHSHLIPSAPSAIT